MSDRATISSSFRDLKTLVHLALSRVSGPSHADRLESFYGRQAADYDSFRSRLLHGRETLFQNITFPPDSVWVDFGAGTGENAERVGKQLEALGHAALVDLCPSLLRIAEQRIADRGWKNVEAVAADATRYAPGVAAADVVTFSYSLTMIPDWFAAMDNAWKLLKPGGTIGIVDFYVSRKYPAPQQRRHGWFTRSLWPLWFGCDNVWLNGDHVPYLQHRFETVTLLEQTGNVPYLPLVRVPYYIFVGRKRNGE